MAKFDACIPYVLTNEGKFAYVAGDRGGATNYGITMATYASYLGRPVSVAEVRAMPLSSAQMIYKTRWWNAMGLDQVNDNGVATAILDVGVNFGQSVGVSRAQDVCCNMGHQIATDGHMGPLTIAAINAIQSTTFIKAFEALDVQHYQSLAAHNFSLRKFLTGWLNRARRLLTLK